MRNKTPKIMKKGFLNVVTALCIGLFAACSQEEEIVSATGEVETVSISAELPIAQTGTRGLPTTDDKHQLRCILEVWDTAENGKMLKRIEKLATEATDAGKLQFSFSVDKNVGYQCLLWADFIDAPATQVGEGDNTTYTDKYYNTDNLKAIDFKVVDASLLFNNPASDAFCGTLAKGTLSVTLKRPFAKVTLTDTSDYITGCTGLGVTYNTPSGYNIATQTTTATTAVSATGLAVSGKNWFSTFIFAPQVVKKLEQDIKMTFTKDDKAATRTVKSGDISLLANTESNVSADFSKGEEGGEPEEPVDPTVLKIGQLVNKDGTVVDEYDAENTVAIVFAVGAKGDDAIGNYGAAFAPKTIIGYAMALTSITRSYLGTSTDIFPAFTPTGTTPFEDNDYNGYTYSEAMLEAVKPITGSVVFTKYAEWKLANAHTVDNLSGWYIPSGTQIKDICSMVYGLKVGKEEVTTGKNEAFIAAYNKVIETAGNRDNVIDLGKDGNGGVFMLSSYMTKTGFAAMLTACENNAVTSVSTNIPKALTITTQYAIRPVLTIFK